MSYAIHITTAAERDMIIASDYIDFTLKNPKAADDLLDEAETKINELTDFPERFPLVDDTVLASWGIRFVLVKNYLAFYVVSEKQKMVYIVRFLYQKSDWISILRSGISCHKTLEERAAEFDGKLMLDGEYDWRDAVGR